MMSYFEEVTAFPKLQSVLFFAQFRPVSREVEQYGIGIVLNAGHGDHDPFGKRPVTAFVCGKLRCQII